MDYGPNGGDIHSKRVRKQDTPATYTKLADEHTYHVHEETYALNRAPANPALASMSTPASNPAAQSMKTPSSNPALRSMAKKGAKGKGY